MNVHELTGKGLTDGFGTGGDQRFAIVTRMSISHPAN
jgi:hypothetical protein